MDEKVFNKVTEYIDAIAQGLGVAASHVYEVMVRQTVISGAVGSVVMVGLCVLVAVVSAIVVRKIDWSKKDRYGGMTEAQENIIIIISSVSFVTVIAAVLILPGAIMRVLNPEYYVIKEILAIFQ